MLGSSRGLESGSTKEGEIHHIATDHGPMVQGGLLTAHPGGVHGYGWSPGGGFSFRQGAGAASPGSPILKRRRRRNREGIGKKGSPSEGFRMGGKYRWKGAAREPPGIQLPPGHDPTLSRATRAPRALVGPLWPPLDVSESF